MRIFCPESGRHFGPRKANSWGLHVRAWLSLPEVKKDTRCSAILPWSKPCETPLSQQMQMCVKQRPHVLQFYRVARSWKPSCKNFAGHLKVHGQTSSSASKHCFVQMERLALPCQHCLRMPRHPHMAVHKSCASLLWRLLVRMQYGGLRQGLQVHAWRRPLLDTRKLRGPQPPPWQHVSTRSAAPRPWVRSPQRSGRARARAARRPLLGSWAACSRPCLRRPTIRGPCSTRCWLAHSWPLRNPLRWPARGHCGHSCGCAALRPWPRRVPHESSGASPATRRAGPWLWRHSRPSWPCCSAG
mmetsp:Transcript_82011/g.227397  ORF Transcript_82011/g.227397 Transcript_82011/m.227397 type:complete len:300 (-) Transcript_82011:589-1488(-)